MNVTEIEELTIDYKLLVTKSPLANENSLLELANVKDSLATASEAVWCSTEFK